MKFIINEYRLCKPQIVAGILSWGEGAAFGH